MDRRDAEEWTTVTAGKGSTDEFLQVYHQYENDDSREYELVMALFDDIVRVEHRPRRQNESAFDYVNTSARPGLAAFRLLLERWFSNLPGKARPDILGRIRSRDEVGYQSAFFELFWHELLRRSGYEVEVHPLVPDMPTNPDFLVSRERVPQFYLEATLAMPPGDPGGNRRLAELNDTLNRMQSPDYFLGKL